MKLYKEISRKTKNKSWRLWLKTYCYICDDFKFLHIHFDRDIKFQKKILFVTERLLVK